MVSIGEGFPPLPRRLLDRMLNWEFIDMVELKPAQAEDVLDPEPDPQKFILLAGLEIVRAKRKQVTHINTWTQCFTIYVAASLHARGGDERPARGQQADPRKRMPYRARADLCFKFNRDGSCPYQICKFRHLCLKCSGRHPDSQCPGEHATKP